mgnify:CR=1 FL=1
MPDFVLTGVHARSPCVYVSKRGDTVLYVGVSRFGIARALTRQHDYLNEILPTDALEVYLHHSAILGSTVARAAWYKRRTMPVCPGAARRHPPRRSADP